MEGQLLVRPLVVIPHLLLQLLHLHRPLRLRIVRHRADPIHGSIEGFNQSRDLFRAERIAGEEGAPEVVQELRGGGVREGQAVEDGGGEIAGRGRVRGGEAGEGEILVLGVLLRDGGEEAGGRSAEAGFAADVARVRVAGFGVGAVLVDADCGCQVEVGAFACEVCSEGLEDLVGVLLAVEERIGGGVVRFVAGEKAALVFDVEDDAVLFGVGLEVAQGEGVEGFFVHTYGL